MAVLAMLDMENNSIEEFTIVGDASIVTTPVLTGTYALSVTNLFGGSFMYYTHAGEFVFSAGETYMHCIWRTQNVTVNRTVMFIYDGAIGALGPTDPCAEVLLVGSNLEVHVYTGTGKAGDESDTGSTTIAKDTNYRLEFLYDISNGNSRGYVEVKLDGTTEASVEHSTTTGYDQVLRAAWGRGRHIAFGGGNDQYYSDMWLNNDV